MPNGTPHDQLDVLAEAARAYAAVSIAPRGRLDGASVARALAAASPRPHVEVERRTLLAAAAAVCPSCRAGHRLVLSADPSTHLGSERAGGHYDADGDWDALCAALPIHAMLARLAHDGPIEEGTPALRAPRSEGVEQPPRALAARRARMLTPLRPFHLR